MMSLLLSLAPTISHFKRLPGFILLISNMNQNLMMSPPSESSVGTQLSRKTGINISHWLVSCKLKNWMNLCRVGLDLGRES